MQQPVQITLRHMGPSEALEQRIRQEAEKLEQFYDQIIGCQVVVETAHEHHRKGRLYHVRIHLEVPQGKVVVSREHHDSQTHEDVYVAVRDAFDSAKRQLEDYARRRRGKEKRHELSPHGHIAQLYPGMDYGIIETADGGDVYFHKNAVIGVDFDKLEVGDEVRFVEEQGEKGPQASTVHIVGRHHIVG
jgi:ribosomal subunit interface protein